MDNAIKEFMSYATPYSKDSDECELKINHTKRVMDLCRLIATKLNFSKEEIEIAGICGLLHDIGRFEQWKKFNTFNDSLSIDHGDLGYEILCKNNNLRKFILDEKYDKIILSSVKYHNKYKIPESLTSTQKKFLDIVRDADKIDILYLYTQNEIVIDTKYTAMSDAILETIKNNKLIDKKDKQTAADSLSISLAFIFDINYKESVELLKERNYINKEIKIYKEKNIHPKLRKQLQEIQESIQLYIEKRMN